MFGLSDPQPSQSVINKHANVLANICKSAADSCYSTLTDVCVSVCMCVYVDLFGPSDEEQAESGAEQ